MTKQEDTYWLQLAVEEFSRRVWQRGLSKFALDQEIGDQTETFFYGDYFIVVSRPEEDKFSISIEERLPSGPSIVILFYFIEYPQMPPEIAYWEHESTMELLENVSEIWQENLFTRIP